MRYKKMGEKQLLVYGARVRLAWFRKAEELDNVAAACRYYSIPRRTGLVDEYHQFIAPVMIGSGNYWLPKDVKNKLELISLQKFDNGVVHLQYNKI